LVGLSIYFRVYMDRLS